MFCVGSMILNMGIVGGSWVVGLIDLLLVDVWGWCGILILRSLFSLRLDGR